MAIATHEPTIGAVDLVVPYVPRLLIDWLRDTPDQRYRSVEGTLAFVDISGFTKMTERLARKGKVGAEEMSDTLNRCFSELLSVAYDYGAGLVKWGGDAVLLLFEGEDHAARACRGAFEMQRAIRTVGRLKTTAGSVTLRMSVGIHSGAFDFFLVGDLHRELVISGPAATECVTMEQIAEAGEIAISETTASLLDPAVLGARKDAAILLRRAPDVDMLRAAPVGAVDPDAIAACLPLLIRDHVLREPGEAEHRFISVAFVEFSGVQKLLAEEGVDALTDALDECMSVAQRETARYSVSFHETDINKDGGKIMLVAGAPTTFGKDQERMLRAVRGIMDAGTRLPLRIGVNAGRVFSGDFGPPFRRTFSVKGDAINLAARVMGKAATGEILATKDVLAGSRREVRHRGSGTVPGQGQGAAGERSARRRAGRRGRRRPPHRPTGRTRARARGSARIAAGRARLGGVDSRPGGRARCRKVAPPRRAPIPRGRPPRPRRGLRGVRGVDSVLPVQESALAAPRARHDGRPRRRGRPAGGADGRHRAAARPLAPAHRDRAGPRRPRLRRRRRVSTTNSGRRGSKRSSANCSGRCCLHRRCSYSRTCTGSTMHPTNCSPRSSRASSIARG